MQAKMNNYLLHHKEKKGKLLTKTFITVLFIVGILIAVNLLSSKPISGLAHYMSAPFWKSKNPVITYITNSAGLLKSKKSLIIKNSELRFKIKESNVKLLEANMLREENNSLKRLFNRQTYDIEKTILGTVLTRPPVSLYDTLVIDLGDDTGIKKGDSVFVLGDIFIGVIDEVYNKTSVVKLFSSPGQMTTVSVGTQNIFIDAEGVGGGNFIAKLPREIGVNKGDIVIIPDISVKVFSVIEEIKTDPTDPFILVFFKNPININEIKWVQVVTENQ